MDPSTGSWRRLSQDPANEVEASWSRNGQWIYFGSDKTGRPEIWKIPASGGLPVQLTKGGGLAASESPDRKWVYYSKDAASPTTLWKIRPSGGEETQVADGLSYSLNFVVANKGIYYMVAREGADRTSIAFLDFATEKTATLLTLDKPWWYGMAISPDQRSILFSVVDNAGSDLMLVENLH